MVLAVLKVSMKPHVVKLVALMLRHCWIVCHRQHQILKVTSSGITADASHAAAINPDSLLAVEALIASTTGDGDGDDAGDGDELGDGDDGSDGDELGDGDDTGDGASVGAGVCTWGEGLGFGAGAGTWEEGAGFGGLDGAGCRNGDGDTGAGGGALAGAGDGAGDGGWSGDGDKVGAGAGPGDPVGCGDSNGAGAGAGAGGGDGEPGVRHCRGDETLSKRVPEPSARKVLRSVSVGEHWDGERIEDSPAKNTVARTHSADATTLPRLCHSTAISY